MVPTNLKVYFCVVYDYAGRKTIGGNHALFRDNYIVKSYHFSALKIVASPQPGLVTVILKSQNGEYLGETQILYVDEEKEFAQRVAQEPELQLRLFKEWTNHLSGISEKRSDTKTSGSIGR